MSIFHRNRLSGVGMAALLLCGTAVAGPARAPEAHDHEHGPPPSRAVQQRTPAKKATAQEVRQAAQSLAQKKVMAVPPSGFRPDQTVTRGELAVILVRMIDYLEKQGPKKVSQSPSPPLVSPRVRASLQALPQKHRAYPAIRRLALGGYLLSSGESGVFMPTRQNIDRPVTARELTIALTGVISRITEKRVVLEHPEVLEQQRETVHAPGQRRGVATPEE